MFWTATQRNLWSFLTVFAWCQATGHSKALVGRVQCPAQVAAAREALGPQTAVVGATPSPGMVAILEMLCPHGPWQQPAMAACRCQLCLPYRRPGAGLLLWADPLRPQGAERSPSIKHPFTMASWTHTKIKATILSGWFSLERPLFYITFFPQWVLQTFSG